MNVHDAIHFAVFLHRQPPPWMEGGELLGGEGRGAKPDPEISQHRTNLKLDLSYMDYRE